MYLKPPKLCHIIIYSPNKMSILSCLNILPHQVRQSDHWSDLDNRCALKLYEQEGCKQHECSYDITGLLTSVWKVTLRSFGLGCLSWPGRRGGRIHIAHVRDIKESIVPWPETHIW